MSFLQNAARTARSGQELLQASGSVISRRLEIAAEAMCNPMSGDYVELALMGSEKVEALTASAAAGLAGAMAFAEASRRAVAREGEAAQDALHELASSHTPADLLQAQGRWAFDVWDRAIRNGLSLSVAALELQAGALAPIHAAATANARRLRRPG
jgi:hypothetical protein